MLSAAELNRLDKEIQAKRNAIRFILRTRTKSAQDYVVQADLFDAAFRLCRSQEERLALLNSWLRSKP